jgi:hypothetical protein
MALRAATGSEGHVLGHRSPPVPLARRASLLAELRPRSPQLWAVLDAARSPAVLALIEGAPGGCHSLFEGERAKRLARQAPYLVRLDDHPLLETLVERGWGQAWGIYLVARGRAAFIVRQLQQMMVVTPEGGDRPLHFRFYDPRVARGHLRSLTPRQQAIVFDEVDAILMEDEDPARLLRFERGEGKVQATHVDLDHVPRAPADELARSITSR